MPLVVDSPRWVRVYLNKQLIADSRAAKFVTEGHQFAYYFPTSDIKVDPATIKGASTIPELPDHYTFDWDAMDAWFEEEEQIYVHPHHPYWRVDCINSSRHIEVIVDGTKVADTHRPCILFETSLPTRFYIPQHDCRLELLEPSDTITRCPYKGEAHYHSVKVGEKLHKNLVWYYRYPLAKALPVQGMLCFFNEKVEIHQDGKPLTQPKTHWS